MTASQRPSTIHSACVQYRLADECRAEGRDPAAERAASLDAIQDDAETAREVRGGLALAAMTVVSAPFGLAVLVACAIVAWRTAPVWLSWILELPIWFR